MRPLVLALAMLLAAAPAAAAEQRLFAFMSRAQDREIEHLERYGARIDVVAPNWFTLAADGEVVGSIGDYRIPRMARARGAEVWPVVNATLGFQPSWLATRGSRTAAARAVAHTVRGFQGVTLDVEEIPPELRAAYTDFVRRVDRLTGRRGVAVYAVRRTAKPPRRSAAAYDWRRLARSADLLLASTYGEHGPPGPPGPISTTAGSNAVIRYAQRISRRRVAPVLGSFGLAWPRFGGRGRLVAAWEAEARRAELGIPPPKPRAPAMFSDGFEVVWYESASALAARARAARRAGMRWLALFSLGREPVALWRALG